MSYESRDTISLRLVSCESSRFGLSIASFLTCFFLFSVTRMWRDNFEAVDLSWIKNATDPLEVLKQGSDFLEDPSKISINNRERVVQSACHSCPTGHRRRGA